MEVIADPEGFRGADREAFTIGCLMSSLKYSGSQIIVRQDGWGQFAPKLAPLPGGGFVAVYEAGPESGTDTNIKGRIFNDDGSPRGSEFTINSTTSGYQDRPSVAVLEDGRLVVAWHHLRADFSQSDIRARILNSDGGATDGDFLVSSEVGPDDQDYPSVAALSDGGFVIGYNYFDTNNWDTDVRAKIYGSDGLPKSAEFIANGTTIDRQERASLTGLANGSFVIVYTDGSLSPDDPDGLAVRGRIISNDGQAGAEFLIPTTTEAAQFEAQVVALTNGNFAVVWTTYSWQSGTSDVRAQVFAAGGTKVGGEILVEAGLRGEAGQPVVASRADGGFIIAYGSSETGNSNVKAVMYNAQGVQDGGSIIANANWDGFQGRASIISLADGNVVVAWEDGLAGSYLTHVRAQILSIETGGGEPTGQVITGTNDGESLTGTGLGDQIIGLGGNDVLSGLAGEDTLLGGAGNDVLEGDGGNDILDGGSGANTATYSGASTDYVITPHDQETFTVADQVAARDGSDHLTNIRFAHFEGDDKIVTLINSAVKDLAISTTRVAENTLTDTVIASLSATDDDGDAIQYSLVSTDGPFELDGGNLVLKGPLDYETKDQYDLTVKADDGYGGSITRTFTISVANVVEPSDPNNPDNPDPPDLPMILWGTAGSDLLQGGDANDILYGQGGNDRLYGGAGNDKLYGRAGKDTLKGDAGQDVFVFDTKLSKSSKVNKANLDKITDFTVKDDTIHLAKSVFKKMAKKGVIKSSEFYQGVKAHDESDHIIYNRKTGALFYDADGTGSIAQIQIATLSKNLKLTYKDFFVV